MEEQSKIKYISIKSERGQNYFLVSENELNIEKVNLKY